jgi:hypothetical protein
MTFPTPGGVPSLSSQLTGTSSGLPNNWQNLPTTTMSFNEMVNAVAAQYGSAEAAKFKPWYAAAWAKDKNITPLQAATAFLVGNTLQTGVGTAAGVTTGVPGAAAKGAETAVTNIDNALSKLNPFHWIFGITGISGWFTRALKVVAGGILLIAGVLKLSNTNKTLETVLPLVGGPAGRLLKA